MLQISNVDKTTIWFDMPSNCTTEEKGTKEVRINITAYEKQQVTVILRIIAGGHKFHSLTILNRCHLKTEVMIVHSQLTKLYNTKRKNG